jgi:hypothetical protein
VRSLLIKVSTAAIALSLMAVSASAAVQVTISDLVHGNPFVTTGSLAAPAVQYFEEMAIITGNLDPINAFPGPIPVGTRSVILLDASGLTQSDFLTLTVQAVQQGGQFGVFQPISIQFESNGASTFAADLAALPANTPTLLEDGSFQDVTALLNSSPGSLQIFVASQNPEPVSLLLMGTGFVAFGILLRRHKVR